MITFLRPDLLQPTIKGEIQSPMGVASVEFIDPREPVAVSALQQFCIISVFFSSQSE